MNRKVIFHLLIVLVCAALLAACQASPASPAAQPGSQDTTAVLPAETNKEQPAADPTAPPTEAPEAPSAGPGEFHLEDPSVGLDALTSYRQSLELAFDGSINGQETHNKTTLRRTITAQPAAQITWLEIDGQQQMYAALGELAYQQTGAEGPCSAANVEASIGAAAFQLQTLPAVRGAEAAGEESINGIATRHYTFDERALGQAGWVKATGEVWVAVEGSYVVKYVLQIEGEADRLGPGVSGVQRWEYQLTDPNAVAAPDLPEACTNWLAEDAAPLPPDAQNVVRLPGFTEFSVPVSPSDAARFYQSQAEGQGWEAVESSQAEGADTILNFRTAEGGLLSIRIQAAEGGAKVTVQTAPKPQ